MGSCINKTKNEYSLENQSIFGGRNINNRFDRPEYGYEPIVDGFKIKVDGSFDAPIDFSNIELNWKAQAHFLLLAGLMRNLISITNYTVFGGTISSWAIDNFGVGTNEVTQLEQDYEIRFTGVYDNGTLISRTKSL